MRCRVIDGIDQHGLDSKRLLHLKAVVEDDVKRGLYYGAVILVARNGVVALHEAIGCTNLNEKQPVTKDSVFSLFSTTKALTNVLVFRAVERDEFALTTKVSEITPEFSGGQRQHITFYHLLTHLKVMAVDHPTPEFGDFATLKWSNSDWSIR
jgi:CubicO group peptidase (beta-lactamase class C family)